MENGIGVCEIDWEVTTGETRSDFLGKEKREGLKKKKTVTPQKQKNRERKDGRGWKKKKRYTQVHMHAHTNNFFFLLRQKTCELNISLWLRKQRDSLTGDPTIL